MSKHTFNDSKQQNKMTKYYISKELEDIKVLLEDNDHEIFNYIIASLIDTIVLGLLAKYFGSNTNVGYIAMSIFGIGLFLFIVWIINKYKKFSKKQDLISGRIRYSKKEDYRQVIVDKFDNVAYPSMILCIEYKAEYFECDDMTLKTYYYFEIVHYASKASRIFFEIVYQYDFYVKDRNTNYIAFYRIDNFADLLSYINCFIQDEFKNYSDNQSLKKDIDELNRNVLNFKEMIQNESRRNNR